jgi:hypothetical protein
MAEIARIHGTVQAGQFYGYTFKVIKINRTDAFTADSVDGNNVITEGGYTKAVKAIMQLGTIVIMGARHSGSDYVSCIVDGSTFNAGPSSTTAGNFGALKDELAAEVGGIASNYTITYSEELNGDGTFTFGA